MKKYEIKSKVNLRLEVVSKREDGYHELAMVNARASLCDYMFVEQFSENKVDYSLDNLNKLDDNLCQRALNDFCDIYNISKRYHIYIEKHIPQGAGLGGGSCDVAAIINYLCVDNDINISLQEKINFGEKYGADVPYCLIDKIAYVEGIGEKINILDVNLHEDIYIICPKYFISTKESFKNVIPTGKKMDIDVIKQHLLNKDFEYLFYNDLEKATFIMNPRLKEIKDMLSNYGIVTMSGSGSSFILIPKGKDPLNELKNNLDDCDIYPSILY